MAASSPPALPGPPCFSTARAPAASVTTAVDATLPPRPEPCMAAIGGQRAWLLAAAADAASAAPPAAPASLPAAAHVPGAVPPPQPQSRASGGSDSISDRRSGAPTPVSAAAAVSHSSSASSQPPWLPPLGAGGCRSRCRRSSPLACPLSSTVAFELRRYEPTAVTGEAVPGRAM